MGFSVLQSFNMCHFKVITLQTEVPALYPGWGLRSGVVEDELHWFAIHNEFETTTIEVDVQFFYCPNNGKGLFLSLGISSFYWCESPTDIRDNSCTRIADSPMGEASVITSVSFLGSKYAMT